MSESPKLSYAVISPVRNEQRFLEITARALVEQTSAPDLWVIVDDGSTDGTAEIAERYAALYQWVRVIHRKREGTRARGRVIVESFDAGLELVPTSISVVAKLDGDLHIPPHYFRWVIAAFEEDPNLGITGGVVYVRESGRWVPDAVDPNGVHGAVKAYRRKCIAEIGGLSKSMGWDGLDEPAARARGWSVRPLTELQVLHYAARGSKQPWMKARLEEGRGAYHMGYKLPFLVVRAGYRSLRERPPVLGGLWLLGGYLGARARGAPRANDELAIRALRAEHRARLRGLLRLKSPHAWRGTSPVDGPAITMTQSDVAHREDRTGSSVGSSVPDDTSRNADGNR